jgi:hypothetical protein
MIPDNETLEIIQEVEKSIQLTNDPYIPNPIHHYHRESMACCEYKDDEGEDVGGADANEEIDAETAGDEGDEAATKIDVDVNVGCEENAAAADDDNDVDVAVEVEVVLEYEAHGPSAFSSDEYDVRYGSDDEYLGTGKAGARDESASTSSYALPRLP